MKMEESTQTTDIIVETVDAKYNDPLDTKEEVDQQLLDDDDETMTDSNNESTTSSTLWTATKLIAACSMIVSAYCMLRADDNSSWGNNKYDIEAASSIQQQQQQYHRRLTSSSKFDKSSSPSYMNELFEDLAARKKLFDDTPPEEVKYWFEYAGPLQKYFYRFSKSRGKADYFEGRDDSGVVSERFIETTGGGAEFRKFYLEQDFSTIPSEERSMYTRILENCYALGAPTRPVTTAGTWAEWFGQKNPLTNSADRCRILFAINTIGAGRGTTMIWETMPPHKHAELPQPWTSEQETSVTHLQRNLEEIDALCESGLFAAKVQIMVCEPIPSLWTEWLDSQLPHCGGHEFSYSESSLDSIKVEDRQSPVQIVVSASPTTADSCHDLKSGFMEKRVQDVVLAPPLVEEGQSDSNFDPAVKTTHPDLFSSDDHDLYVAMRWSSLVTFRAVHSFLRASADIAAAATASTNVKVDETMKVPGSRFLIPSFVRVSYVSEENPKVAKWRMHGDFFHPAAWEICKDSFEMTFIPHSLSGEGGVRSTCEINENMNDSNMSTERKLSGDSCGQWWAFFTELQMPTSPEVYANEVAPPPVEGGSNFFWMITDRQRREIVKGIYCLHDAKVHNKDADKCPDLPQAVIPLGDMESFLINYTPNTALGREHTVGRRPGYSREEQRTKERQAVKERKQLNGQEEIESALFDYTIYPAALFHKDATIKAARTRDRVLTQQQKGDNHSLKGPQTIKSSYYDVSITKPRPPVLGWCQAIARKGLCSLYSDYIRLGDDTRCAEACGLVKDFTPI